MSAVQIEGKQQLNSPRNKDNNANQLQNNGNEGKSHIQHRLAASDLKIDKGTLKACAAFNLIFSAINIGLILYALNTNVLSTYSNSSDDYFHCEWDGFDVQIPNMDRMSGSWLQKYDNCNFHSENSCTQFRNSYESGLIWHYCNTLTLVSLIISVVCCLSLCVRKYIKHFTKPVPLKNLIIITTLFETFIPMILLLFAIIYWFEQNRNEGCWAHSTHFQNRKVGQSMIVNIATLVFIGIYFLFCITYLRTLFAEKSKKKRKIDAIDVGNDMEGYDNNLLNNDEINIGIEQVHFVIRNDDFTVQKWFSEDVSIESGNAKDYKQMYCDKFVQNGFDNFVAIKLVNEQDLSDIGIEDMEHRQIIMSAIQTLKL